MAGHRTLSLSKEQETELTELRNQTKEEYVRERCAALLKIAGGQSAQALYGFQGASPITGIRGRITKLDHVFWHYGQIQKSPNKEVTFPERCPDEVLTRNATKTRNLPWC